MTRKEVDQVAQQVGGHVALANIMLQIVKAVDSPLIRAFMNKPKNSEGIYEFFADGPGDIPIGFYLYTLESSNATPSDYDILKLVYGYFSPDSGELEYTFPLIRTSCGSYSLIYMKNYASNFDALSVA